MFTKPKKPAPVDEEDLLFEIQDPSAEAAEAGVAEVRVGPGTIPLVFEDAGCGARVAAARAPLDADVGVGWRLVAVNGIDVAGVGADGVRAVLEKRSSEDRKLRFETGEAEALEKVEIAVDGATIVNLGLDFDAAAKPAVVAAVAAESPLAGRVAVGAKLVFARLVKATPSAYALRFLTPPPRQTLLDCATFAPGDGERFDAVRRRASAWISASELAIVSVETVDGESLRVWFDALDRRNRRARALDAVAKTRRSPWVVDPERGLATLVGPAPP
ncbi:hypothetical protein AURANDRAFT_66953 [Aureococcus anophagefferens]|uniref:Uncharacterized protein n=1 Tax=Aureococcus anophagefferens TaxID=44056 RepID=F0YJE7_AURAN|nr:hypothetical protein AURANDRAFT_66953 [Aureococcus anophagefferens]EGB04797.1 hypothetical protein AURANDRAFT_66953 [Aureococcus anophagefferens]|eukprot:XP_009040533.1 hypothetical protein AURANDRAFT_66953 [Aureococcus anophagefferens]